MTEHVPDRVLPEAFEPEPQPQPGPDRTPDPDPDRIRQLEAAAKARRARATHRIRGARKRTFKKNPEWGRRPVAGVHSPESAPAPTPAPDDLALGIAGGGAACQLEGDDV